MTRHRKPLIALAALSALCLFFASSAIAQQQGGGMEEFEEIDPYTENDPAKFALLGYSQVGSFGWAYGERTENVQATMGGLDFLWVETEHFRIGSSLGTYKIPNDREEKDKLKEEFKQLKKKLGRFKAPKKELDPWIRLHLYAQRAENLYADYVKEFGLEAMASDKEKPYLGHPKRFLLLICERKSELGRYLRAYEKAENEYSFTSGKVGETMLFALNNEVLAEAYKDQEVPQPIDSMLHTRVVAGLARNFINGHNEQLFNAPIWLSYGTGYHYARKVDPRWVLGGPMARPMTDDHHEWDERVAKLVDNKFFASMADMFRWLPGAELNERDHMVMWSKVEFMILDLEGDLTKFLNAVVVPFPGLTAGSEEELEKRQAVAFAGSFDVDAAEFDEKWTEWAEDR
ncbi:hypothetical protein Poly30_09200 [Planctomycetes bacterium Poly30]|uniref:DUF1570 domain-containing protein n=1 Tax=Saltatorellus ferox TaxID=2528018 RepID=A0A518EMW0_9BACT|nr:hypothetical protein Poly30_09200 [Planctomycetes bacterium Poly30]